MPILHEWINGKFTRIPFPKRVLATISAFCNLACSHCYWAHDLKDVPVKNWKVQVDQIAFWDCSLIYAGRLLVPQGAGFLKEYYAKTKKKFSIIDNGYTVLSYEDLLPLYEQIAISIDGEEIDHDEQRNKKGAFAKAWGSVLELKKRGYDPVVSSALSPISISHWKEFEERLRAHDVLLSTTLVWNLKETKKRNVACLNDLDVKEAFDLLVKGVPKLINLYSLDHIIVLKDVLKSYTWEFDFEEGFLYALLKNRTRIIYRPESVLLLSEIDLLWDGKFYDHEFLITGKKNEYAANDALLAKANALVMKEKIVWDEILGGDSDGCTCRSKECDAAKA